MNTHVAVHLPLNLDAPVFVHETGNPVGHPDPIDGDTNIRIDLSSDVSVYTSIQQWRRICHAVDDAIVAMPSERNARRMRAATTASIVDELQQGGGTHPWIR